MTRHSLLVATASIALLICASAVPSNAAQVNLGGLSVGLGGTKDGGTKAGVNAGGLGVSAKLGGGGGNITTAKTSVGGNNAKVSIGTGGGPLLSANSNGNPLGGGSNTNVGVNLGSLTGIGGSGSGGDGSGGGGGSGGGSGGGPGGGGSGGGGSGGGTIIVPRAVEAALTGMSSGQRLEMKRKCGDILARPGGYEDSLVILCQVLRRI
jgi:hypothetical protein